jgi:hypothetical protein
MNTHALIVPKQEIDTVWLMVSGFVDAALQHSNHEIDTDTVYFYLKDGRMNLWVLAMEEGAVMGAVVTEFIKYPLMNVCRIVALGGHRMEVWLHHVSEIEAWAREHDCSRMDTMCRIGFEKRIKHLGYAKDYIHMGKAL